MRRRATQLCVVTGSLALALLVVLCAAHAGFAAPPPAGMSAPTPLGASFESAAGYRILGPHFDWQARLLPDARASGLRLADGPGADAVRSTPVFRPHYGPLHRRPPPRLF